MACDSGMGQPAGPGINTVVTPTTSTSEQAIEQRDTGVDAVGVLGASNVRPTDDSPSSKQRSIEVDESLSASNETISHLTKPSEVDEAGGAPGPSLVDVTTSAPPAADTSIGAKSNAPSGDLGEAFRNPTTLRPRPASAPSRPSAEGERSLRSSGGVSPSFGAPDVRRSVSSPGFTEGGHHTGQSLVATVDIATESRVVLERRFPRAVPGRAASVPDCRASSCAVSNADFGCGNTSSVVSHIAGDLAGHRRDPAPRGGGRPKGGDDVHAGSAPESKSGVDCPESCERKQDSRVFPATNAEVKFNTGSLISRCSGEPKPATANTASKRRAGCESKPTCTTKAIGRADASAEVECPLDFRNAAVKLKFLAAEASIAVDGNEKAWRVSKEQAEVMFNDLRSAAEEDAQRSGEGAASETRHRLQRIVVESGLENSRRVEKEAALEEIVRVLRQDTAMYEARASATDRMLRDMKTLEAENDSCDLSALLECRRTKSLNMLRDRTERERDELRAACRRRREEAAVMDSTLAEARHAQKLLLGHAQQTVERMVCLAEYVSIMRRWCKAQLKARQNARMTSKAINNEFERKSKELDALLKKGAPTSPSTIVSTAASVHEKPYGAGRRPATTGQQPGSLFPDPVTSKRRTPTPATNADDDKGSDKETAVKAGDVAFLPIPSNVNETCTDGHTTTLSRTIPINGSITNTDTSPNDVATTPDHEKGRATNKAAAAAGSDDSSPFETLRDASMRLRRLLFSLSTHVSEEAFSDSFAPAGRVLEGH